MSEDNVLDEIRKLNSECRKLEERFQKFFNQYHLLDPKHQSLLYMSGTILFNIGERSFLEYCIHLKANFVNRFQ